MSEVGGKRVFLPAKRTDLFGGDDDEEEDEPSTRHELLDEFGAVVGELDMEDKSPFGELIDDIREEEEHRGIDEDVAAYALFETNHPR